MCTCVRPGVHVVKVDWPLFFCHSSIPNPVTLGSLLSVGEGFVRAIVLSILGEGFGLSLT